MGYRRTQGGQGWWWRKVGLIMLETEWIPSGGLIDVVQIRPRQNEKLESHVWENTAGGENLSARETVVPSVAQPSSLSDMEAG